jgi:hypothetical protein
MKLFLHDPSEKVITLHHYLSLYAKEDIGNLNAPKRTIISEFYDEIVFIDPLESVYDLIMANQITLPEKKKKSDFDLNDQAQELQRLDGIFKNLSDTYIDLQSQFLKVDQELDASVN